MTAYLAVLFLINGEWTLIEGFEPLVAPNMEHCEEVGKPQGEAYLSTLVIPDEFHVFCFEAGPGKGPQALKDYIRENLDTPT